MIVWGLAPSGAHGVLGGAFSYSLIVIPVTLGLWVFHKLRHGLVVFFS